MCISRFIIHPFSPFRWHWDLMMVILIVYTVVAIPTAVAFFADGNHAGETNPHSTCYLRVAICVFG